MSARQVPALNRRDILRATTGGLAALLAGCGSQLPAQQTPPTQQTPVEQPDVSILTDYNTEAWQTRWEQTVVPAVEANTGVALNVKERLRDS
jgi:hypothetical protein